MRPEKTGHGAYDLAHRRALRHAFAPGKKPRRLIGHRSAHAGGEKLRHVKGDIGEGTGAGEEIRLPEFALHLKIVASGGFPRRDCRGIVQPVLEPHQADDGWEEDLVRFVFEKAGLGAGLRCSRPQSGVGLQMFEIFEDLGRIEDLKIAATLQKKAARAA